MQGANGHGDTARPGIAQAVTARFLFWPLPFFPDFTFLTAQAVEHRRVFVLIPFAMVLGLVSYASLPHEPQAWFLAASGVVLALIAWLRRDRADFSLHALTLASWVGLMLLPATGALHGTEMLARPAYGHYQAVVDEIISANDEAQRVVVYNLTPLEGARALPINKARLFAPATPKLAPGDSIRAKLRLTPVPGPVLPGAFDSQFHAYFSGIGAYGNVTSGFERVTEGFRFDPARLVETTRMAIGARLDAVLDGPSAAIAKAMVVGDQSAIDDETRDIMAASGLAHIYSISGLHLSIVAGGIFFLLRLALANSSYAATHWPIKKLAAIGGLAAAFFYLLLAGGLSNVPALRSTIMLGLIFGAVLAGRRALTMRNVAIAAIAIILIDPASVFRASFQLSFAAVVALIGMYEMPRPPKGERAFPQRLWGTVWATAVTSLIAGLATLLFSAYHFQQTAPLGVLGNVLVLPVVSLVIMPFAVLSVLVMPIGMEEAFVRIMGFGIDRMVEGAALVAAWSEGITGNPILAGWALLIGVLALGWFAFFQNWWRMLGPLMAVPMVFIIGFDARPTVLIADTTQAVVVRTQSGMGLVTGRAGSFAVDVWSDYYQEPIIAAAEGLSCDSLACIVTTPDFSLSVIKSPQAFAEDCSLNSLVVTRLRVTSTCEAPLVIDESDLARGGVHWLRWNSDAQKFELRTAIPNVTRPWRVWRP